MSDQPTILRPGITAYPAPKPGVYKGVPEPEYRRWDALNISTLSWMSYSPHHVRQCMKHGTTASDPMSLGTAIHTAILEPERFKREYIVKPKFSGVGMKKRKEDWEEQHRDYDPITAEGYATAIDCVRAVQDDPECAALTNLPGWNEVSFTWVDSITGILCKGRADRLVTNWCGNPTLVDYKKTRDARRFKFERAAGDYNYDLQAAFYLRGLNAHRDTPRRFVHVAIETTDTGLRRGWDSLAQSYELDDGSLDDAGRQVLQDLQRFAWCWENDKWPGYGEGLESITIPKWVRNINQEEL